MNIHAILTGSRSGPSRPGDGDRLSRLLPAAFRPTLAGGVMLGLAFPPIGFWPLAWGAMIPLLVSAGSEQRERVFLHGLAFFVPALGIPYHWVALHRMAVPALVSTAAVIAVAVCAAAMIALFAGRGRHDRPAARVIAAAACLLLFEQILIHGPVPFPSAVSGYSMADAVWLDPVLRASGVSGVSFLLVATSAAAAALLVRRPSRRARHAQALIVLSAFTAGWIVGPTPAPEETPFHDSFRVTLVQPALEPETWADTGDPDRISALERRIEGLMGLIRTNDPGLVILPETALPAPALAATGSSPDDWVSAWSDRLQTAVLSGAITHAGGVSAETAFAEGTYTNSAILARPGGAEPSRVRRYEKQILVPFAERVPFVDVLPFMGALSVPAGGIARYAKGTRSTPLPAGDVRLGLMICFESLFPQLARRSVIDGADILVVLTQDGWWRSDAVRRQHLLFSRMRAVETGLPLIQVSVDGESGVFDHRGRLRVLLPSGIPAAHTDDVPLRRGSTLYAATGDTPVHILVVLILIIAVVRLFLSGRV